MGASKGFLALLLISAVSWAADPKPARKGEKLTDQMTPEQIQYLQTRALGGMPDPELVDIPTDLAHCESWGASSALAKVYDSCRETIGLSATYQKTHMEEEAKPLRASLGRFAALMKENPKYAEYDRLQTEYKNARSRVYRFQVQASRCPSSTGQQGLSTGGQAALEGNVLAFLGEIKSKGELTERISALKAEIEEVGKAADVASIAAAKCTYDTMVEKGSASERADKPNLTGDTGVGGSGGPGASTAEDTR